MNKDTTDNYIIKLKVATFISVITAVAITSIHITRTVSKIEQLEDKLETLDNRITKTTGRNAEEINKYHGDN
jgi:hypothetical protein